MGCNSYDDDERAATVYGEDLLVEDVKYRTSIGEDELKQNTRYVVQSKLVQHENREAGLDLQEEVNNEVEQQLTHVNNEPLPEDVKQFYEEQAEYFNVEIETYYADLTEANTEFQIHLRHYLERHFGDIEELNRKDPEYAAEQMEGAMVDLMERHEKYFEIYID